MYYPCNTDFSNNALEIKVIIQNYDDVGDDRHTSTAETAYDHYKIQFGIVVTYYVEYIFEATTQLLSNILCLLLGRHFKKYFSQINLPRFDEEHATNIYVSSIKKIEGGWCAKLSCGKNILFGALYEMETER